MDFLQGNDESLLIKVPEYVFQEFMKQQDKGNFATVTADKKDLKLTFNSTRNEKLRNQIFKVINISKTSDNYYPFNYEENRQNFSKRISYRGQLVPSNQNLIQSQVNQSYQKLENPDRKSESTEIEFVSQSGKSASIISKINSIFKKDKNHIQITQNTFTSAADERSRNTNLKRVRMEKEDLFQVIFKEFELNPKLDFQSLQKKTDQPLQYLKEVLQEVADEVKINAYNKYWKLKENYLHNSNQEEMKEIYKKRKL